MSRSALLPLALLLLAVRPAAPQKASPGQVAYVEGLRAFDAGDYAVAAERMRAALAEDGREGTARFRYRAQNVEDYFPHFWLGLSLEKLGDRSGTLAALRESERQGAVAARPALRRILAAALARVSPPVASPTPTPVPPTPRPEVTELPEPTPVPSAVPPFGPATARPPPTGRTPALRAAPLRASPETIREGLRAFLRGDYARAELLLVPESTRSPRARLLLAWSLGGRYVLSEPREAALLARARSERGAALAAGAPAGGAPWVSPAILELFGDGAPPPREGR